MVLGSGLGVRIPRPQLRVLFSQRLPNDLRIDVAVSANVEAQFNAPPHHSELN
jgi:hypothetical protein